jgi:undecaprenyl-diphosphatase
MAELIGRAVAGDEAMLLFLLGRRQPRLDRVMRLLTNLGGAAATVGLAGALLALLPHAEAVRVAAFALAVSFLAVQVLKRAISRPRPTLPVGMQSSIEAPDRFSFPSGHAAASLSVALGLGLALPGFAAAGLAALGGLVGGTRCYLGVHYPGDVLVGWCLALVGVLIGVRLF